VETFLAILGSQTLQHQSVARLKSDF